MEEIRKELKPLILIVDDNPEILEFISDDLEEKYDTIEALNGNEALKILKNNSVNLIISDIMMPDIDGYELCKLVKLNFEYSHIPVILLTAKNSLQSKIEGLEIGADAYIEKPFSPQHLQVQIASLLYNRQKIRDFFANSPLVHIKSMAYSKADEHFLEKLNMTIQKNIHNTDLDVDQLAESMNMSRPTLYRKIKAISNLTPNELIHIARLKRAAELLAEGQYKLYEISDVVGYNSQNRFARNFHKQFGVSPSAYFNQLLEEHRR